VVFDNEARRQRGSLLRSSVTCEFPAFGTIKTDNLRASLTEARDLVPYLQDLMPLVHEVLVDPVPEARATAAKSLGTLVERLGETNFPNLVNELMHMLRSEVSGVDRQGAAQGLSEVLSGLGMERLEGLLPEIINNTASARPYVREGFISLLVYLPATFGHRFAPHLAKIIPPILKGLADDSEYGEYTHPVRLANTERYSARGVHARWKDDHCKLFVQGYRSALTRVGEGNAGQRLAYQGT
jgi:hypothetical protein